MCLLMAKANLDRQRLTQPIRDTFRRRKTHPIPASLPEPPATWLRTFAEMAKECVFPEEIANHFASLQGFLQPVLAPIIRAF